MMLTFFADVRRLNTVFFLVAIFPLLVALEVPAQETRLGKGNGSFKPAQTFPSGGAEAPSVAIADVNKDGRPDLVLACVADTLNHNSTGVVTVLINNTKKRTALTQREGHEVVSNAPVF